MFKKPEVPTHTPASQPEMSSPYDRPTPTAPAAPAAPAASMATRATIGRSITIRGEVSGDEDLLIQGRVDGSVDLKQHAVTVGPEGEVKASITARLVTVEGSVEGDLRAEEQIILRSSARVQGDLTAPRVVLEDGARFRGGVDMGEDDDRGRPSGNAAPTQARKAPESGGKAAREPRETATEKERSPSDPAVELAT